jgi:hypothetical protein
MKDNILPNIYEQKESVSSDNFMFEKEKGYLLSH